ncbi:MAG: ATP-binding protein [Planctomycetia bacterium]|nr:ATP-binding protein [Planctomycetia bacterium]
MNSSAQPGFLGTVSWDGANATSERVLLRTNIVNRQLVERNQYVRIDEAEGARTGYLARVVAGPFFHRAGTATVGGMTAGGSLDCVLMAELEIQGEIVEGRPRDTNSRPSPGSPIYALGPNEIAGLHGLKGDMLLGHMAGQDELQIFLQSKNKGVLPRNLGIFGTVGSGKSNTSQVVIEEAARAGWAVIILDVEGEYTDMDLPTEDPAMIERLARYGRQPEGLKDFHVFYPASCASDKAGAETFTARLADFETSVIGELLQVTLPERNALLDCVDYLNQKARSKLSTTEKEGLQTLLDASPQAKLPFTLRSLRERASERSSKGNEFLDYAGLTAKLNWIMQSEAFDQLNMPSLDPVRMMVPGRVSIIDVSVANDVVKNMVTADLLRKTFALKITRPSTPPTLLILEEAHSFISRERAQSMQATLTMLRNVTRRGRKRWLSMAFVSQQPGHLPPEIFELCNTRIVHTLRSMHNLEALMTTTGDVGRDLWDRCPLLGPGQAILSSPQMSRSVVLSVRPAACRRKFTD